MWLCKKNRIVSRAEPMDVKAEVYGGSAVGGLSFDLPAKNASFKTNAQLRGINLAQLLAAFANGGGKMTGKMEGDVRLAGEIAHSLRPLAGIHGAGHLTVRNGQVPSLKLNANLMKLAHFNDLGPAKDDPSSFKLITTDLELADQRISSKVIDIDGYGVYVDGSGSVSVSGSDELIIETWDQVPLVLQQMDGSSPLYGYIGMDDYMLYPIIRPGAFVRIDPRQKKVLSVHWHSDHDRPIFFVELRERYVCSWCEMHDGRLILIPSQQSKRLRAQHVRYPAEATIIGRVTGVTQDLVEPSENEARA